jgi:hypothetical protein
MQVGRAFGHDQLQQIRHRIGHKNSNAERRMQNEETGFAGCIWF